MKTVQQIIDLVDADGWRLVDALEDGELLAALGITDEDREAVEEAHALASICAMDDGA